VPAPAQTSPLVSVVMPCHDEVEALGRTLSALASQRGGTADLEVVLVDNDSTDPRLESVWRAYRDRLALLLIRRGALPHPYALCGARNLGLAAARGVWIWTLDSDSAPAPGALDALRGAVATVPAGAPAMLTGERIFIDAAALTEEAVLADGGALETAPRVLSASNYEIPRDRRFPEIADLPDLDHPWDYMHGGNTVFRREDALAIGGYDESFDGHWGYEDDEFAHRMIAVRGCVPGLVAGLEVFHQEPSLPPPLERRDKSANPNWHRICTRIPGYRDHKIAGYDAHGIAVLA
jgi:glycosyltransferase involved in cell wall biosynthesis